MHFACYEETAIDAEENVCDWRNTVAIIQRLAYKWSSQTLRALVANE